MKKKKILAVLLASVLLVLPVISASAADMQQTGEVTEAQEAAGEASVAQEAMEAEEDLTEDSGETSSDDKTDEDAGQWIEDELSGIEDTAAHTCTITFQGNNAYNFSMGVTDKAGNETQYQDGESEIFMVDKEKPTVKVQTNPNQWEVFEEESKILMPVVAEGESGYES